MDEIYEANLRDINEQNKPVHKLCGHTVTNGWVVIKYWQDTAFSYSPTSCTCKNVKISNINIVENNHN